MAWTTSLITSWQSPLLRCSGESKKTFRSHDGAAHPDRAESRWSLPLGFSLSLRKSSIAFTSLQNTTQVSGYAHTHGILGSRTHRLDLYLIFIIVYDSSFQLYWLPHTKRHQYDYMRLVWVCVLVYSVSKASPLLHGCLWSSTISVWRVIISSSSLITSSVWCTHVNYNTKAHGSNHTNICSDSKHVGVCDDTLSSQHKKIRDIGFTRTRWYF